MPCLGCMYEADDNMGGPDDENGICMSCENGDMYNAGTYGGVY